MVGLLESREREGSGDEFSRRRVGCRRGLVRVEGAAVVFGRAEVVSLVVDCQRAPFLQLVTTSYLDEGSCWFLLRAVLTGLNSFFDGLAFSLKPVCSISSRSRTATPLPYRRHGVDHACCVCGRDTRSRLRKDRVTSCSAMMASSQWRMSRIRWSADFLEMDDRSSDLRDASAAVPAERQPKGYSSRDP